MMRCMAAASAAACFLAACGGSADVAHDGDAPVAAAPVVAQGEARSLRALAVAEAGEAVFTGNRGEYSVARSAGGFSVTPRGGGITAVGNVSVIRFADISINTTIAAHAGALAPADARRLIELYIAFFNRVPEADGLVYWIGRFRDGMTINQIAESFYTAAIQYSSLTGYSAAMSNSDFVRTIYKNVLGRSGDTAPPDEDVQYWAERIGKGGRPRGELVSTMLDSAHTFAGHATWGWVTQLLLNKITAAETVAVRQGLNWNTPEESIAKTQAIAAAVTPDDTSRAMTLMGFSDNAFDLTLGAKE